MLIVKRYHDFSCAHRAVGDDGPCGNIHGHNYRATFSIVRHKEPLSQGLSGRVLDFSDIKNTIIAWIEAQWDHRLLLWTEDPLLEDWLNRKPGTFPEAWENVLAESIVTVGFNTSSENMADFLRILTTTLLKRAGYMDVMCISVELSETRKCGATSYGNWN